MSAPLIRPNKCVFHGAHGSLNNVYDSEEWKDYTNKVHDTPYKLENLAKSLSEAQYHGKHGAVSTLSEEMKEFFMVLYREIPQVNVEAYSKQALENIVVIRHDVQSNNCKWIKLGCKKCGLITDPLYFAAGLLNYQELALEIQKEFWMPYNEYVLSAGGELMPRQTHWCQYWEQFLRTQTELPPMSSTTASSSSQSSRTESSETESSPGQWVQVPQGPSPQPYQCAVNACRLERSVIGVVNECMSEDNDRGDEVECMREDTDSGDEVECMSEDTDSGDPDAVWKFGS